MIFEPSAKDYNAFLRKSRQIILRSNWYAAVSMDGISRESVHFLEDVIRYRNMHYKLYVILLLLRSNKDVRELILKRERPEVIEPFLVYLDHELQLFLTGYRPPTTLESAEMVKSGDPVSYVKDDVEKFQYHCVEILVYRVCRFYRSL